MSDPLNPRLVGKRYPQFASGSSDTIYAIEVDHPSGRWEQIWVLRSEEVAQRVVDALAAQETPPADLAGLLMAVELHALHCDEFQDLHEALGKLYARGPSADPDLAGLRETLRPVIDKALVIQQRARRTAISAEDWRYTNGYNDCLAAVLSILDPDDTLRWVRDPEAEALRLARAALAASEKGDKG